MTVPRKTTPDCPIERFIAVISGRWKAMVIWRLLEQPLKYSDMTKRIPEITERVLSQVLKDLEKDGVVERTPQKAWKLTALGYALKPSLKAMFEWGKLSRNSGLKPQVD